MEFEMSWTVDEIATGGTEKPKLRIAGRPLPGGEETYCIFEEPGEPILTHWRGSRVPHFKRDCPNCRGDGEELKAFYYVGAKAIGGEPVILELTPKCFKSLAAAAAYIPAPNTEPQLFEDGDVLPPPVVFAGLVVKILRANSERSIRILRCESRAEGKCDWQFRTREELCRIWGIPLRPKLFREDTA